MRSSAIRGIAGNAKLRGRLEKDLPCGCCSVVNLRKPELVRLAEMEAANFSWYEHQAQATMDADLDAYDAQMKVRDRKRALIALLDRLLEELGTLRRVLDENERYMEADHAKAIRSN